MRARALLTLFALVVAAVAVTTLTPGQRRAEAAPSSRDRVAAASGDATSGIAIVATSTGHSILARGLVIQSGTAGLLELRDGSSAGTVLARLYVPQNSTVQLGPDVLGSLGVQTTKGNSLFAARPTGARSRRLVVPRGRGDRAGEHREEAVPLRRLLVGEDLLGGGMRTSRGNALYAVHAATTNFTLRFNEE